MKIPQILTLIPKEKVVNQLNINKNKCRTHLCIRHINLLRGSWRIRTAVHGFADR